VLAAPCPPAWAFARAALRRARAERERSHRRSHHTDARKN
jgi:hypothetical protein